MFCFCSQSLEGLQVGIQSQTLPLSGAGPLQQAGVDPAAAHGVAAGGRGVGHVDRHGHGDPQHLSTELNLRTADTYSWSGIA